MYHVRTFLAALALIAGFGALGAPAAHAQMAEFSIKGISTPYTVGVAPYNATPMECVFQAHRWHVWHACNSLYPTPDSYEITAVQFILHVKYIDPFDFLVKENIQYYPQPHWIYRNVNRHLPPLPMITDGLGDLRVGLRNTQTGVFVPWTRANVEMWGQATVTRYYWDPIAQARKAYPNKLYLPAYAIMRVNGGWVSNTPNIKGGIQVAMAGNKRRRGKRSPLAGMAKPAEAAAVVSPYQVAVYGDTPTSGPRYDYIMSDQFAIDDAAAPPADPSTFPPPPLPFTQ
jgi:hypothetical protein